MTVIRRALDHASRGVSSIAWRQDGDWENANILAYYLLMQILSVSKVRDRLNDLVDSVAVTRDQVTITKNGSPAAVLIGADEWESLQETLFWLSRPGNADDIDQARRHFEEGRTFSEDQIRAEFGVPRHDADL